MKPATLSRSADFRRVHSDGKRARRDGVGVTVFRRDDEGPARVGYVVRKSAGGAVVRNRIKRRLRAVVAATELPLGVDVVISGGPEVLSVDFQVLENHVQQALVVAAATR